MTLFCFVLFFQITLIEENVTLYNLPSHFDDLDEYSLHQ